MNDISRKSPARAWSRWPGVIGCAAFVSTSSLAQAAIVPANTINVNPTADFVKAVPDTTATAYVGWKTTSAASYLLRYKTADQSSYTIINVPAAAGPTTIKKLTGLAPGQNLTVQVAEINTPLSFSLPITVKLPAPVVDDPRVRTH